MRITPGRTGMRVLLVTVIVAAAFAALTPPAAAGGRLAWIDDAVRAISQARNAIKPPNFASSSSGVDDASRSLTQLIDRPPPSSPDVAAKLNELRAAQARISTFRQAVGFADQRRDDIPMQAEEVAAAATADAGVRTELRSAGEAILRDLGCDLAADGLLPAEREGIKQSGWQDHVPEAIRPVAGPLVEAVTNYAQARLARQLGPGAGQVVDWTQYANGILDKRGRFEDAVVGTVESPDGTRTRAYVQYVRMCLRPPR